MTCLVIEGVRFEESDDHRHSMVEALYSEWVGADFSGRYVYTCRNDQDTFRLDFEGVLGRVPDEPVFHKAGWVFA